MSAAVQVSFYNVIKLLELMQEVSGSTSENGALPRIRSIQSAIAEIRSNVETQAEHMARADESMAQEVRRTQRLRRPFQEDDAELRHIDRSAKSGTFIAVVLSIMSTMSDALAHFDMVLQDIVPGPVVIPTRRGSEITYKHLQDMAVLQQINQQSISRFVSAVASIDELPDIAVSSAKRVAAELDAYYQVLVRRHTIEGVQIHHNPVTTDIAMQIYANIDSHGEISDGRKPDEISAYSLRKAAILAATLKSGAALSFVANPDDFIDAVTAHFNAMWSIVDSLSSEFKAIKDRALALVDVTGRPRKRRALSASNFSAELELLHDLNPNSVTFKDKSGVLTAEERFELGFRNDTLANVAARIIDPSSLSDDLVQYVLDRKAELHRYFVDENSFYTCKISTGNQFLGEAPGALEVVPSAKPCIDIEEIVGGGFGDIRAFVKQVEASGCWHDLFVATSPSRTADKSNVLLIGPQGCGKTEAMRGIGANRSSVAIFAQGSDFLTCWSGEAQKNPKRLFEQALDIHRKSDRHVYLLIDEIDQVLHTENRRDSHANLTREFQILMDGVVAYPGISVWGATNHPERIPMPMLRRFSKALIVGELDRDDRAKLLRHYCNFMPCRGFDGDSSWLGLADRLEGATGDVVRKVVDPVWRGKMHDFTGRNPAKAKEIVAWLNRDTKFDVRRFSKPERSKLHTMLAGDGVAIEPDDIGKSIDAALANIAILTEISTAKQTYITARSLVADLRP